MNTTILNPVSVYPGEFVPIADEAKNTKAPGKTNHIIPDINLKEFSNSYEVHMLLPGFEREEFIIYSDYNSLLIGTVTGKKFTNTDINISMPENADTELAIAEYRNSILHLYVPKANGACRHISARIVVY
jgi:HSP20 family protein